MQGVSVPEGNGWVADLIWSFSTFHVVPCSQVLALLAWDLRRRAVLKRSLWLARASAVVCYGGLWLSSMPPSQSVRCSDSSHALTTCTRTVVGS